MRWGFAMNGINAHTGQALSGIDHLRQSIRDILTTRIGTRVMRRDYGSRLPTLVDTPEGVHSLPAGQQEIIVHAYAQTLQTVFGYTVPVAVVPRTRKAEGAR